MEVKLDGFLISMEEVASYLLFCGIATEASCSVGDRKEQPPSLR